ncbi:MAG: inositol monophosphatase family protein [Bacteroidia bacterium]
METLFIRRLGEGILEIAAYIRKEFSLFSHDAIEYKTERDVVSYVDYTAELRLRQLCEKIWPGGGWLCEESGNENLHASHVWIIDPLDGTKNFVHGLPFFAISVGLQVENQVILGMVCEVMQENLYWAVRGQGAYQNQTRMQVSATQDALKALIATGFNYQDADRAKKYFRVLERFLVGWGGIRRVGSAALDLAYVAKGCFEGFFEIDLNPWDVAAGALLVQEAGGKVTDFQGGQAYLLGRSIVAANGALHPLMLEVIQKNFVPSEMSSPA